jgi:hypothetical protein
MISSLISAQFEDKSIGETRGLISYMDLKKNIVLCSHEEIKLSG